MTSPASVLSMLSGIVSPGWSDVVLGCAIKEHGSTATAAISRNVRIILI